MATPPTIAGTIVAPSTLRFSIGVESVGDELSTVVSSRSRPSSPAPDNTVSPRSCAV